jgi:hypothetical protein
VRQVFSLLFHIAWSLLHVFFKLVENNGFVSCVNRLYAIREISRIEILGFCVNLLHVSEDQWKTFAVVPFNR